MGENSFWGKRGNRDILVFWSFESLISCMLKLESSA